MATKKKYVPTEKEQRVAVDFLEELTVMLYFNKDYDGNVLDVRPLKERLQELIDKKTEQYYIESDPFTNFPCITKEYCESRKEYERQIMMEHYGHCDGL